MDFDAELSDTTGEEKSIKTTNLKSGQPPNEINP